MRRRAGRKISPTLKDENLNKITHSDLKKAEIAVVSYVQRQTFSKEIEDLKRMLNVISEILNSSMVMEFRIAEVQEKFIS